MAAKFHLCLLLIILGTLAVKGARLENKLKNPLHIHAKRQAGERFYVIVLKTTSFVVRILFHYVVACV